MAIVHQEQPHKGGNGKRTAKGKVTEGAITFPEGTADRKNVEIKPFKKQAVIVWLVGDSRLVVHRFSEKAKKEMLDKMMGTARHAKGAKNPVEEYDGARYTTTLADGRVVDAFPAATIKKSIVDACRLVEDVAMTLVRQVVRVKGDLLPIQRAPGDYYHGDPNAATAPNMREDPVRVGGKGPGTGTADLRYRPEYNPWTIEVEIEFLENMLSMEKLVMLLHAAGFGSGIGENRPGRTGGDWGTFQVFTEIDDVREYLAHPPALD